MSVFLAATLLVVGCKKDEVNSNVSPEEATQTLKMLQTINNSFNYALDGNTKAGAKLKDDGVKKC
ncbi:MAG: hypothetical protein HC817_14470 [Saprospiraceae bacterium]|nr:hypothetical protein [Saprospiraceae bacterium]